jgi:hypothetical protein
MVLGMTLSTFTALHVLISLIGIASGFVVVFGWLTSRRLDGATAIFLVTTVLTSVTGYLFPLKKVTPGDIVGAISLAVLALAIYARYWRHMEARWRSVYVVTGMMALYLNVFVLVVQLFEKVPALHALAPTGSEPPFAVAQLIVLAIFIGFAAAAVRQFRIGPTSVAPEWTKTKAS